MGTVVIRATHQGPRGIGHGGYVAGLLAREIDGAAQVTLRRPAPLDVALDVVAAADGRELRRGDDVIADAIATTFTLDVPTPPSPDEARAAEQRSPSWPKANSISARSSAARVR